MWIPSKRTGQNNVKVLTSVVDLVTLNLDPDPGFWPSLDPDPRLYYQFERKKLKIILEQYFGSGSVWISIKKCRLDPDPHAQMRIQIQEIKKAQKTYRLITSR